MNNPGMDAGLILYGIYSGILTLLSIVIGLQQGCTQNPFNRNANPFLFNMVISPHFFTLSENRENIVKFKLRIGINQPVSRQKNIIYQEIFFVGRCFWMVVTIMMRT